MLDTGQYKSKSALLRHFNNKGQLDRLHNVIAGKEVDLNVIESIKNKPLNTKFYHSSNNKIEIPVRCFVLNKDCSGTPTQMQSE